MIYNRCDALAERSRRIMVLLSSDARSFQQVYQHDGTVFGGQPDNHPLTVKLKGQTARYVRLQLPGHSYFHLDEVEVYGAGGKANLALASPGHAIERQPVVGRHDKPNPASKPAAWSTPGARSAWYGARLQAGRKPAETRGIDRCRGEGARGSSLADACRRRRGGGAAGPTSTPAGPSADWRCAIRSWTSTRSCSSSGPGPVPAHVRPVLRLVVAAGRRGLRAGRLQDGPAAAALPDRRFRRGAVSSGPTSPTTASKCCSPIAKFYAKVADLPDKATKANLPEDAFYHVYEVNLDGAAIRQLTHGRYDDFDAHYLPGGDIVFLSTRKGRVPPVQQGEHAADDPMPTCPTATSAAAATTIGRCPSSRCTDGRRRAATCVRSRPSRISSGPRRWPTTGGSSTRAGTISTASTAISSASGRPIPTAPIRNWSTAITRRGRR